MNTKGKLFIFVVIAILIISTIIVIYDKNVCDPEWLTIEENLEYIKKTNSIKEIELYKAYNYPKTNLIEDTIRIVERNDIDCIQEMLNNRYEETLNHPIPAWSIRMKLTLDNQKTIYLQISKVDNDTIPNMTHLIFGSKCSVTRCSKTLGKFLEHMTSYNGANY